MLLLLLLLLCVTVMLLLLVRLLVLIIHCLLVVVLLLLVLVSSSSSAVRRLELLPRCLLRLIWLRGWRIRWVLLWLVLVLRLLAQVAGASRGHGCDGWMDGECRELTAQCRRPRGNSGQASSESTWLSSHRSPRSQQLCPPNGSVGSWTLLSAVNTRRTHKRTTSQKVAARQTVEEARRGGRAAEFGSAPCAVEEA